MKGTVVCQSTSVLMFDLERKKSILFILSGNTMYSYAHEHMIVIKLTEHAWCRALRLQPLARVSMQ